MKKEHINNIRSEGSDEEQIELSANSERHQSSYSDTDIN